MLSLNDLVIQMNILFLPSILILIKSMQPLFLHWFSIQYAAKHVIPFYPNDFPWQDDAQSFPTNSKEQNNNVLDIDENFQAE